MESRGVTSHGQVPQEPTQCLVVCGSRQLVDFDGTSLAMKADNAQRTKLPSEVAQVLPVV